jgi:NAD(P)H-flavin reductase
MAISQADTAPARGPLVPVPFRVTRRTRETPDTWTLELSPEREGALPEFAPGQFAMLYVFGKGEVPISVSGDLTRPGPLVLTIRRFGPVTAALCTSGEGANVGVRGPFGSSWPLRQAEGRDVLLVAGGIGLAPLRSAVYHLSANRERFGNVVLLYGGRSPAELLYREELEHWRGRFDMQVDVTVDRAPGGWRGRVGVVPNLIPRAELDPGDAVAMVCGPEVMMRFTAAALMDRGLAADRIFLTLERNMRCAIGLCGHCQLQHLFICKDGPVFPLDAVEPLIRVREL